MDDRHEKALEAAYAVFERCWGLDTDTTKHCLGAATRAYLAAAPAPTVSEGQDFWGSPQHERQRMLDRIAELERRLAAPTREEVLEEALRPFAAFADALAEHVPDDIAIGIYADGAMRFGPSGEVNVGALRVARRALARTKS